MWFHIRTHSTCISGALNVMQSVEFMQILPARLQDGIMPLMQRNAYWVHPEAVLLAIVVDSDIAVRAPAVGEI